MKQLIFLILLFPLLSYSKTISISSVKFDCGNGQYCLEIKGKARQLHGTYSNLKMLRKKISNIFLGTRLTNIYFSLTPLVNENNYKIVIHSTVKPVIKKIEFSTKLNLDVSLLESSIMYRKDDLFYASKLDDFLISIKRFVEEKGFAQVLVSVNVDNTNTNEEVSLIFDIKADIEKIISQVKIESDDMDNIQYLLFKIKNIEGQLYDRRNIEGQIEDLKRKLLESGYLFSKITISEELINKTEKKIYLKLKLNINLGKRFIISFFNNKIFSHQEIMDKIRTEIKNYQLDLDLKSISKTIFKMYEAEGFFETEVEAITTNKIKKNNSIYYVFKINEGTKYKINSVRFMGRSLINDEEIQSFYSSQKSDLVNNGYYDVNFFLEFRKKLWDYYLTKGFASVRINRPIVNIINLKGKKFVNITYKILEGNRTILNEIVMNGIDEKLKNDLLSLIDNKIGAPLNLLTIEDDLKKITEQLHSIGYFKAIINNYFEKNLLVFEPDHSSAKLVLDIRLGNQFLFNDFVIAGNSKTKLSVIKRELTLKKNAIITQSQLKTIKENLLSLGVFPEVIVEVIPLEEKPEYANILVLVKEKEAGVLELAPGYRTDLGAKLGTSVTYTNFAGSAQSLGLKAEVNRRVDNSSINVQRPYGEKKLFEYSLKGNYSGPYTFSLPLHYQIQASSSFKRYYAFDATINKVSVDFSKQLNDYFSATIGHQLESIGQEHALEDKDQGHFRIGGITPGVEFGILNSNTNPTKGISLGLSIEFANPYWGSQSKDPEINYYTAIARLRTYWPIPNGVFSFSTSLGQQKNFATANNGRIPPIKVFRLGGLDLVRGFRDDEINNVRVGGQLQDMSDVDIHDKAFFINYKIGPKFYLSDDTMLGFFVDAGRIYVNHLTPFDVRVSVGTGIRYITPVGPLDFDYGIKLKRESKPDGNRETEGQFHISIGIF